jgi:hypothetical protein
VRLLAQEAAALERAEEEEARRVQEREEAVEAAEARVREEKEREVEAVRREMEEVRSEMEDSMRASVRAQEEGEERLRLEMSGMQEELEGAQKVVAEKDTRINDSKTAVKMLNRLKREQLGRIRTLEEAVEAMKAAAVAEEERREKEETERQQNEAAREEERAKEREAETAREEEKLAKYRLQDEECDKLLKQLSAARVMHADQVSGLEATVAALEAAAETAATAHTQQRDALDAVQAKLDSVSKDNEFLREEIQKKGESETIQEEANALKVQLTQV